MGWTVPTVRTTGDLITASIWNTDIVNNLAALQGGLVGSGFAELDLLGTGSAPAVSTAGHATLYFDNTLGLLISSNGAAYFSVGAGPDAAAPILAQAMLG